MSDFFETIEELRGKLAQLDAVDALVFIDNRAPTALSSYRGYYDNLAIERTEFRHEKTELDEPGKPFDLDMAGYGVYTPGSPEVKIKADPTVTDMIAALDLSIGATFEGYKGGQFTMDALTDLWVSEYGEVDRRRIFKKFSNSGDRVNFITYEIPYS